MSMETNIVPIDEAEWRVVSEMRTATGVWVRWHLVRHGRILRSLTEWVADDDPPPPAERLLEAA